MSYSRPRPRRVVQFNDESCWAAALESWLDSLGDPSRVRSQAQLLKTHTKEGRWLGVKQFKNVVRSLGMDIVVLERRSQWTFQRVEERLRARSAIFVGYESEKGNWWHDVVLYGVTNVPKGEPTYDVMDPGSGSYTTFTADSFFPLGPKKAALIGWKAIGAVGTEFDVK